MEVIIGKSAGFCNGVRYAVTKAEEESEKGKVYCLGELVHNKQVIQKLENNGMITVNSIEEVPYGENLIIRAHGEAKNVYQKAKEKNLNIIDLTCGKVKVIHNKVNKASEDSFIIIIGNKNHPEIIGIKGFSGDNSFVIETEDDIIDAYKEYEKSKLGKIYVVCQTTISEELFEKIKREIENNFVEAELIIDNTRCDATKIRQNEVNEMSKIFNKMIIIGGKKSSNTKKLANIAKMNCNKVYLIETIQDLEGEKFEQDDRIGIMSGASTPESSINDVKNFFENIKF